MYIGNVCWKPLPSPSPREKRSHKAQAWSSTHAPQLAVSLVIDGFLSPWRLTSQGGKRLVAHCAVSTRSRKPPPSLQFAVSEMSPAADLRLSVRHVLNHSWGPVWSKAYMIIVAQPGPNPQRSQARTDICPFISCRITTKAAHTPSMRPYMTSQWDTTNYNRDDAPVIPVLVDHGYYPRPKVELRLASPKG